MAEEFQNEYKSALFKNILHFEKPVDLPFSLSKMDEAMASMLADFVDCPPDDDDRGASHS